MAVEFGTGKTICILAIVAGCFAVLWPKLFYPMLQASITTRNPIDNSQGHHRQERPPHLHPDMLHPALRERGRAIPQSHVVPRVVEKEGRPGPVPGMRPPMGGAGHVVPAPKGSGTMGILMPIYTIGIVVFFMYTVMKVMFKKPGQSAVNYSDFNSDPEFRKIVFSEEYVDDQTNSYGDQIRQKVKHETSTVWKTTEENGTKLGWKERDTRDIEIDHLRKRLEETEAAMERIVAQMGSVPHKLHSSSGIQLIGAKGEDALYEKRNEMAHTAQEEVHNLQNSSSPSDTTQKALRDETAPDAPTTSEEEKEEEEVEEDEVQGDRIAGFQHMNDMGHVDDAPTTTNYTTASTAAEATGSEETAADYSALDSFGPSDDQQEELEDDDEEVWNGDVGSAEDESEEEAAQAQAAPQNMQRQQR